MAKISIPKTAADFNDVMTAWCAGIVDGEGSVELMNRTYKGEKGRYKLQKIAVGMTHEETILKLGNYFGRGAIWRREPIKAHYLPCWYWVVVAGDARFVAQLIQPFCVTKTKEIAALLAHEVDTRFGKGKITAANVRRVRELFFFEQKTRLELSKQFNVTTGTIWGILTRNSWADTDLDLPTNTNPVKGRPKGTKWSETQKAKLKGRKRNNLGEFTNNRS